MATCQCRSFFILFPYYDIIYPSHIHHLFTPKTDPNVSQIHQSNGLFVSNQEVKMHPCLIPAYVQLRCPFSNFQTVPNSWGWWILWCIVQVPLRWYTWRGTNRRCEMQMIIGCDACEFLIFWWGKSPICEVLQILLFHTSFNRCRFMKLNLWYQCELLPILPRIASVQSKCSHSASTGDSRCNRSIVSKTTFESYVICLEVFTVKSWIAYQYTFSCCFQGVFLVPLPFHRNGQMDSRATPARPCALRSTRTLGPDKSAKVSGFGLTWVDYPLLTWYNPTTPPDAPWMYGIFTYYILLPSLKLTAYSPCKWISFWDFSYLFRCELFVSGRVPFLKVTACRWCVGSLAVLFCWHGMFWNASFQGLYTSLWQKITLASSGHGLSHRCNMVKLWRAS